MLLTGALAARLFVPALGDAAARRLRAFTAVSRAPAAAPAPPQLGVHPPAVADPNELIEGVRTAGGHAPAATVGSGRDAGADARATPRSVFVSKEAVLRYAKHGRPSGVAVPGGVEMHGVNGTGLRDGDVLVSVQGTPVANEDDVTGVVISALGAGAKTISGVAKRGEESIAITVEVPSAPPRAK